MNSVLCCWNLHLSLCIYILTESVCCGFRITVWLIRYLSHPSSSCQCFKVQNEPNLSSSFFEVWSEFEWIDNICVSRSLNLRRDWKWIFYFLYIRTLDVEPAAMLHEENKQYTVKRSEPRYNRDILIYSLISSLLRELHDTASLSFNYPIVFPLFRAHFHFFFFFFSFTEPSFLQLSRCINLNPVDVSTVVLAWAVSSSLGMRGLREW